MQFLGLLFEFLEATFGVTVDDILGVFTDIELGLERLRRANDAFLETFQTHFPYFSESPKFEKMDRSGDAGGSSAGSRVSDRRKERSNSSQGRDEPDFRMTNERS